MTFFFIRIGIYVVVTLAVFQMVVVAVTQSLAPTTFFKEGGPWEWAEFSLIAASGLALLITAHFNQSYKSVLQLCGLLAILAAVRELDRLFEVFLYDGAYKLVMWPLLASFAYLVWKYRQNLAKTLANFSKTAPFCFFVSGLLVAVYAQVIGQAELWDALMEGFYSRTAKRVSEELAEFMSYLMILFGAIEAFFLNRNQQQ